MSLKIEAEIKLESDPCVLSWGGKLYIGTEDGSIICLNEDLSINTRWSAHSVQVFALATGNGRVYTASNDAGVRVWSSSGNKLTELPPSEGDVGVLRVYDNELYVGDELGNITVFEDDKLKAKYNVLEEVKDLALSPPFLFTVRDLDVTVTEIKPDESNKRFTTRHTMEGRAPLRVLGPRLLLMARGGNLLRLHDASADTTFKLLHEVKVSDMIVTSIATYGDYAWTGGWDGYLRRWKIDNEKLTAAGELQLGSCINALVATAPDIIYGALAGGRFLRLKVG